MHETELSLRQRRAIDRLRRLLVDSAAEEKRILTTYDEDRAREEAAYKDSRRSLKQEAERQIATTKAEYDQLLKAIHEEFERTRSSLRSEEERIRGEAARHFEERSQQLRQEHQEASWETQTVYTATKSSDREEFGKFEQELRSKRRQLEERVNEAHAFLASVGMDGMMREVSAPAAQSLFVESPEEKLSAAMDSAARHIETIKGLSLPRYLRGSRMALLFVAALPLLAISFAFLPPWAAILVCLAGSPLIGGILYWLLFVLARGQVAKEYNELLLSASEAERFLQHVHAEMAASFRARRAQLKKRDKKELKEIDARFKRSMEELTEENRRIVRECDEKYPRLLAEATQRRDDGLRNAQAKYPPILREHKEQYEATSTRIERKHKERIDEIERRKESDWASLAASFAAGTRELRDEFAAIQARSEELFPPWNHPVWNGWQAPDRVPPSIRFGQFDLAVDRLGVATPSDDELRAHIPPPVAQSALLAFPDRISCLLKATGDGLTEAGRLLQSLMLRMLTSIPPGKAKFTILDPVGLGQDFAAFMHLADHDESLVNSRIWTESSHIEDRLSDLTEHMENVIQKYLRNEYETLEAYNEQAGEVAEPYRVVVVSRFPVNFTESAIRRLQSVLSAGSRCGVYALISVDTKQPLPHGMSLADLEKYATRLVWNGNAFTWMDDEFGKFPLRLDEPPDAEFATRILGEVGRLGKEAGRVEVPFRVVIPPEKEYWHSDSRREVAVPLGRAGATKLQELALGRGTSQHVLVAGKTGSGKSTLLHALITSAALRYSPNEVEFYLIDFKKGVEFKTYATHALPHARVIAIESEREFGLSVMQRLDAELKIRGDKFRELGLQDIGGYRDLADRDKNLPPMPRILFIVDEFQEFFVADDRIAQDAALLLDRLVRQGRAFGIHVLLGSQTLGGAYSLARSTLGQMAIRIALQCSESDAHLILSEDNAAARLLSRPGEAIYNDANGRIEGNNVFQVVWLPDEEREVYLDRVRDMAVQDGVGPRDQIVFEGNVPADITKNRALAARIDAPTWKDTPAPVEAWLGEAIEIKDATCVTFRRQSGANLLVIGQQEDAALSVLTSALVSLASQLAPADSAQRSRGVRFYFLDGSLSDSPFHGYLGQIADAIPHPARVIQRRDLTEAMGELQAELDARQLDDRPDSPEIFLVIHDLGRVRDLRRGEDDFGFSTSASSPDAAIQPEKVFATLLKEGPALGIHTIVWCDGLNNLSRTLDRATMKEFELRVLLQMSPADSSNLIDSPLASRLGPNRAYFHHEDEGRLEKFRPYAVPDAAWLAEVGQKLTSRAGTSSRLTAAGP